MKIYWLFLVLSLVVWAMSARRYRVVRIGNHYEERGLLKQGILLFAVMIFFCGLRSGIADTGTYIYMFESWPSSIGAIDWPSVDMEKGFYLFSVAYKQFVSEDYQGWLFIIALICGIFMMRALLRYSSNFGFSCFLFIATTIFTYFVNGMRQFICIAIVFACTELIINRKLLKFLLLIIILSFFHASVIIFIPVYFIANIKPWTGKMWLWTILAFLAGLVIIRYPSVTELLLSDTDYANYTELMTGGGAGSNIFRLIIAFVPVFLAFIGRNRIRQLENPITNLCVNMSVINLCLYFVATFTSGMTMGRLAVYFEIYNLLLLPWLIKHIFTEGSRRFITIVCVLLYVVFFYYQMAITWNMVYESKLLHLFL